MVALAAVSAPLEAVIVYEPASCPEKVDVATPFVGPTTVPIGDPVMLELIAMGLVAAAAVFPNASCIVTVRFATLPAARAVTPPVDRASLAAGPGAIVALKSTFASPAAAARNVCVPSVPPVVAV